MGFVEQKQSIPFVDLAAQYASLSDELAEVVAGALASTDYILGRNVALFEEEFGAFCGAQHAVGVDSGTSALELSLRAFDIGPGDEVITAANTFIATALAISYTGARPVLVDIDEQTYNINAALIEESITPQTRAIIPVHLYGQPADMDPILAVARRHGLVVIEDACQAHGALYKGSRVGSLGDAAAFSFYPAKNLGACGDGGMMVTGDQRAADRVRALRDYGQTRKYHHAVRGYNRRLDTLQAAILRVKLRHLAAWNEARNDCATHYDRELIDLRLCLPSRPDGLRSVWHLYVIRTPRRDQLQTFLASRGISTGIHYPIPIHLQPAYSDLAYPRGAFPVTELTAEQILSLPLFPELTLGMVRQIADAIRGFTRYADQPPAQAVTWERSARA